MTITRTIVVTAVFFFAVAVSSAVVYSASADPKHNCSIALESLGYQLRTHTFEEAGWVSREKHIFNGSLSCYVNRDKSIHSIEDNGVVVVKDGFFWSGRTR